MIYVDIVIGAGPSTQAATAVAIGVHPPQPVAMGATQVYRPAPVRPHQTQPLDMVSALVNYVLY